MRLLERYLDPREASYFSQNVYTRMILEYSGTVDIDALSLAVKHMARRYPVLGGKIRRDTAGVLLYVPSEYFPELHVSNGDRESAILQARDLKKSRTLKLDDTGEVDVWSPVLVINESGGGCLIFGVDHSVIDKTSLHAYISDLWKIYAQITTSAVPPLLECSSPRLPKSPFELLTERWIPSGSDVRGAHDVTFLSLDENASTPNECAASTTLSGIGKECYFNSDETSSLRRRCHADGIGIGSFFVGAMLHALHRRSTREAATMRVLTIIDYRKSVDPPIAATETTCMVFPSELTLGITKSDTPRSIAKKFKDSYSRELSRRDLLDIFYADLNGQRQRPPDFDLVLNSSGDFSLYQPEGIRFTGISEPAIIDVVENKNPPMLSKSSVSAFSIQGNLQLYCGAREDLEPDLVLGEFLSTLFPTSPPVA